MYVVAYTNQFLAANIGQTSIHPVCKVIRLYFHDLWIEIILPINIISMLDLWIITVFVLGLLYFQRVKARGRKKGSIPGPLIGRLTTYYRVWLLMWGDAPRRYAELHRKYGPVVQTGPYHISISESRWIPIVYDNKHRFRKVSYRLLRCTLVNSRQHTGRSPTLVDGLIIDFVLGKVL